MVATNAETEVNVPIESNMTSAVFGEALPGEYFEAIVWKRIEEKKRSENRGNRKEELDLQTWQFSNAENVDNDEICCGWSEHDATDCSVELSGSWFDNSIDSEHGFSLSEPNPDVVRAKLSPSKDFSETINQFTEKRKAKRSAKGKTSSKKKWRVLSLEQTGFNTSLFPRQPVSDAGDITRDCVFPADFYDDFTTSEDIIVIKEESKAETSAQQNSNEKEHVSSREESGRTSSPDSSMSPGQPVSDNDAEKMQEEYFYSRDLIDFEEKFLKFEHLDIFAGSGAMRRLRHTKKHREQKAHNQVKTKHCRSVKNNNRKRLYVKHIVYKRVNLEANKMHFLPSPKRANTVQKIDCKPAAPAASRPGPAPVRRDPAPARPDPRTQRHALTPGNIPSALQNSTEMRLIRLLIDLQHREVTPNDYELLLTLDSCVKPKTVDPKTLSGFRTEKVCDRRDDKCPICMESFSVGDVIKILPCSHGYHEKCIDTWLSNSSMNCPVDGLPVSKR